LERALERKNMLRALRRVERNGGAPGVDEMTVEELRPYLRTHWKRICAELLEGRYRPQPVRRVDIPKPGGGMRPLGIPTVLDRLIQQALLYVLTPIFDPHFSEHSYGYRPGRRAHDAVRQAREHIREGKQWVVDLDLDRFFDRVNHDMVMARVARRVRDKRVLKLLRAYLNAGVMINGVVMETAEGTSQGGPLSPLLANILLDDLDRELERRGHRFIRYADDCNIYVRSQRAGERVLASVKHVVEQRLKLRVNEAKSAVVKAHRSRILGFTFLPGGALKIRIAPEALSKVKGTIRRITRRSHSRNMATRIQAVNEYLRGWIGYFALAETPSVIEALEEWGRRRMRLCLWRQWRRPRTRYRELRSRGVPDRDARQLANTRRGPWCIAGKALGRWLGIAFWTAQGLESVTETYHRLRVAW
jgi:group II intron reverse transcriptase/maturase